MANPDITQGAPCFRVYYKQSMGKTSANPIIKGLFTFDGKTLFRVSRAGYYLVKKRLPIKTKEEVALRIFLDVSYGFEKMQAGFPFFLSSGFSQEDLVSNLIGFYSAVRGLGEAHVQQLCQFTSKKASLEVWDNSIKDGKIGDVKNKDYTKPNFYQCSECKSTPQFPHVLKSIKRAGFGSDCIEYKKDPELNKLKPKQNFDVKGNAIQ